MLQNARMGGSEKEKKEKKAKKEKKEDKKKAAEGKEKVPVADHKPADGAEAKKEAEPAAPAPAVAPAPAPVPAPVPAAAEAPAPAAAVAAPAAPSTAPAATEQKEAVAMPHSPGREAEKKKEDKPVTRIQRSKTLDDGVATHAKKEKETKPRYELVDLNKQVRIIFNAVLHCLAP